MVGLLEFGKSILFSEDLVVANAGSAVVFLDVLVDP
jgi:hypothetical protein